MSDIMIDSARAVATVPAEEKKKPFPFMKLSGELRNRIYNNYFQSLPGGSRTVGLSPYGERAAMFGGYLRPFLPIIQCSHDVRKETASILFQDILPARYHTIMVRHGRCMMRELKWFCRMIKPWNPNLIFEICFSNCLSHEPLSFAFVDAIAEHMSAQLGGPTRESMLPAFERWMRKHLGEETAEDREFEKSMGEEIENPEVKAKAIEDKDGEETEEDGSKGWETEDEDDDEDGDNIAHEEDFEGGVKPRYEYKGEDGEKEENFWLLGPLAKIDWAGFYFDFPERVYTEWELEIEAEMAEMEGKPKTRWDWWTNTEYIVD